MRTADSSVVPPADRELMRGLGIAVVIMTLLTASYWFLHRTYGRKFFDLTGRAQWIWAPHRVSSKLPVVFFASREFDLPERRHYTKIKILGDPEYTLYLNGRQIGARRTGDDRHLDLYDVSKLAKTGRNRIVVAVRSSNGVGGLIAGIDIGPESENVVVTGPDWNIHRAWVRDLPLREPRSGAIRPALLGQPPSGRWNYLGLHPALITDPPKTVIAPREIVSFRATVPVIDSRRGVEVVIPTPMRAMIFDFKAVTGHVRLRLNGRQPVPPVALVRLANTREEAMAIEGVQREFVFGQGEESVTDPHARSFRYVVVYGGRAVAEVVK